MAEARQHRESDGRGAGNDCCCIHRRACRARLLHQPGVMPIRFRASGCFASIALSLILTVIVNVLLKACF